MTRMPENREVCTTSCDRLVIAERELARRRQAARSAKTEVRRLRRRRRRELIRKAWGHASGVARTVTRILLVLGGMVAFVIGVLLYLHGQDGGTCLGAAAAAWGLAAMMRPRR